MLRIEHWLAWLAAATLLIVIAANPSPQETDLGQTTADRTAAFQSLGSAQIPVEVKSPESATARASQSAVRSEELEGGFFNNLKITDILLALFTGAVAWHTYSLRLSNSKLWLANQEQLASTERSFRPWISISPKIESALVWNELEASLTLAITIRNVGKEPAFDVRVRSKELAAGTGRRSVAEEMALLRKAIRRVPIPHEPKGIVLFPDETSAQKQVLHFLARDADLASRSTGADPVQFCVLICIDYRSAAPGRWHQTAAAFSIVKTPATEGKPGRFSIGETVSADFMDLFPEVNASFAD